MKRYKTILQTFFLLAAMFVAAKADVFAKKPFTIKLIEKPVALRVGQTYTFAFEVQNTSDAPLTLSSLCASSASLFWDNGDGTGGGTGTGCGNSVTVIGTDYDPKTGKFICVSHTYPYSKDDFFTLQPDETKRLEAKLTVPSGKKPKLVTVTVAYESKYDGSAIGIRAWTGASSEIKLKMRVQK